MQGTENESRYARWVVLALILAFTAWFSLYSIRLHDAHLTHMRDLGQMDLAIWNTSRGRLLQEVKADFVSTRLTDHVEPVFVPVSLVFWLWDDVRALLVLQAAALAAGAWPIYQWARSRLGASLGGSSPSGVRRAAAWGGVVFAAAYLLAPALQAAAVSEFHALPLAAPLIAWTLWTVESRKWGWFVFASALLISTQEGMALLGATLGLYALAKTLYRRRRPESRRRGDPAVVAQVADDQTSREQLHLQDGFPWPGVIAGAAVMVLSLAWFGIATFLIIPHYAGQAYGIGQTPYAARYGALGDSFGDVLKAMVTQPGLVASIAFEPLRVRYLFGLLAPTAFLALLGPEILLLSLPLLLANLLSSFPLQYSGGLHYSAPLVPFFIAAAAVGLGRLLKVQPGRRSRAPSSASPHGSSTMMWPWLGLVLIGALGWHIAAGYTPIGQEFWRLVPGGWPQVTAHDRLLDRFASQIPSGAPAAATADLYPHLSHRELLYEFPKLGQAQWVLVDVSGTTDRHPVDIRTTIQQMLADGWGVVDAADGYMLLARGRGAAEIPDAFYDFARGAGSSSVLWQGSSTSDARSGQPSPVGNVRPSGEDVPQYPLSVRFGDKLRLLGYDLVDDPKWRRTRYRFYWQALEPLPGDTAISLQMLTPAGEVVDDTAIRPMPALVWYPPARWRVGETVVTETLPWYLPREWAPVMEVSAEGAQLAPAVEGSSASLEAVTRDGRPCLDRQCERVRLQPWVRRNGRVVPLPGGERDSIVATNARFTGNDWAVQLTGYTAPSPLRVAPGRELPVTLYWQANGASSAGKDYTVFLHLRDQGGQTVGTGDATPTWFTALPTSQWPQESALGLSKGPSDILDAHALNLPSELPPGRYSLVIGWYDWLTGERLALVDGQGNVLGNEFVLGHVIVDPKAASKSDLCCLFIAECCASLE